MDRDLKRHFLSALDTGHRHEEMTKMLQCSYCGNKFKKAERDFNRFRKEYPEKFLVKTPEYKDPESDLLNEKLQDRIENDSLYHKHNKILQMGTQEERAREMKRFWNGFYEKNTGDRRRKTI